MADDLRGTAAGCEEVRAAVELLALDALDPAERDELLAHVDGCVRCRAELDRGREAVGSLLLLAPEVEPPPGFTERALGGAPVEGRDSVGREGRSGRHRPTAARILGVAAACLVVAVVLTALGLALGGVFTSDERAGSPPATTAVAPRSAALLTAAGGQVGSVVVGGARPTLTMAVDAVAPGVAYDCVVRAASGELVQVGSWTPAAAGRATWSVALDPALAPVDQVLLVGPDGATLATADLS